MSLSQRMAICLGVICLSLAGLQFWRVTASPPPYLPIWGPDELRYYQQVMASEPDFVLLNWWARLGFNLLFGSAAIFVVLKKNYSPKTETWAFGVLSLIIGVWIGSFA